MFQHFSPLGRLLKVAQIRPHITAEYAEGRRLADTIGAYETKHLASTRCWQSMQLEAISAVTMCHLAFQTLG